MPTLTFDQINVTVAGHWQAEAARTAPKPTPIRTVYALGSLLADLNAADRRDVLALLRDELAEMPVTV